MASQSSPGVLVSRCGQFFLRHNPPKPHKQDQRSLFFTEIYGVVSSFENSSFIRLRMHTPQTLRSGFLTYWIFSKVVDLLPHVLLHRWLRWLRDSDLHESSHFHSRTLLEYLCFRVWDLATPVLTNEWLIYAPDPCDFRSPSTLLLLLLWNEESPATRLCLTDDWDLIHNFRLWGFSKHLNSFPLDWLFSGVNNLLPRAFLHQRLGSILSLWHFRPFWTLYNITPHILQNPEVMYSRNSGHFTNHSGQATLYQGLTSVKG